MRTNMQPTTLNMVCASAARLPWTSAFPTAMLGCNVVPILAPRTIAAPRGKESQPAKQSTMEMITVTLEERMSQVNNMLRIQNVIIDQNP